jgi:hypothetical protein
VRQLDSYGHGTLPLLDIKRSDVVMFIWKDKWLGFRYHSRLFWIDRNVSWEYFASCHQFPC